MQLSEHMGLIPLAIGVSTLVMLPAWAMLRFALEMHRSSDGEPLDEQRPGKPFDARVVTPRIQQVRIDPLRHRAKRPHGETQRRQRVDAARQVVGSRGYFQHIHPEPQESLPATL